MLVPSIYPSVQKHRIWHLHTMLVISFDRVMPNLAETLNLYTNCEFSLIKVLYTLFFIRTSNISPKLNVLI